MSAGTISRHRPKDDSSAAIRAALESLRQESAGAHHAISEETARRPALLLNGTDKEIRTSEEAARDAALTIERVHALVAELNSRLAEAVAREAGDAMAERVRAATAAIERFNKWLAAEYTPAANQLVVGLELEKRAIALREQLRDPATQTMQADLPQLASAHVGSTSRSLGFLTRLPAATPGSEPAWWPR
jgi:hypothetical protein